MATRKIVFGSLFTLALVAACGSGGNSANGSANTTGGDGNAPGDGTENPSGFGMPDPSGNGDGSGMGTPGGTGNGCSADAAPASLQPVYLGVAFDVSGSMGKLDKAYHDPKLKWEPVVAASKSFFNDPQSTGISASLTFFPIDASEDLRCDLNNYLKPDVGVTKLPSTAFAQAIDAITPKTSDDWRGGTPTLAVVQGTIAVLQEHIKVDPSAKHAFVLITDGYPAGCDDDTIESVNAAVSAVAGTIPTYVIGVKNPSGGPDTVTNLNGIAVAGGTKQAFIVETGDPEKTKADFKAVIDGIRQKSISCTLEIPPLPAGKTFDSKKVNVTYTSGATENIVAYDETCATANAWHYDDPASPKTIVLCEGTCKTVQADAAAGLHVEFGCDTVVVPK